MSHWNITKAFDFCYGHRVWRQELNKELSANSQCACRHLHGHQGRAEVTLRSSVLNEQGMVTDFLNLNFLKPILDDVFDHKMVLHDKDPFLKQLLTSTGLDYATQNIPSTVGLADAYHLTLLEKLNVHEETPIRNANLEVLEGLVIVMFVPTSENFAKFIHGIVTKKFEQVHLPVEVSAVKFYETPKSCSEYEA